MMKLLNCFVLLIFATFYVKNGKALNQKQLKDVNRLLLPPKNRRNNISSSYSYINLKKTKEENEEKKKIMIKRECPLRKVYSQNILRITGITVPLVAGAVFIYKTFRSKRKKLSEAEKNLGEYLYKCDSSVNTNLQNDEPTKNFIEKNKPFNIYNHFSAVLNNIKTIFHFFQNVKKVKTEDVMKEYTILFFHSYNVDAFLRSRNIKTYVERLKEIYEEINKNDNVNIIYIPLDNKLIYNVKHLSEMNWYSVLFNNKKDILRLIKKYNIMNIPTMVLLNKNMNVVHDNINYLLLYKSKDFPYSNINNLTYIDYLQDKNNNKIPLNKLKSDYMFFYFNDDKENKEDLNTLLNIKKKLAEKNVQLDIVYIRDVKKNTNIEKESREKQLNEKDDTSANVKDNKKLEGITKHENTEESSYDSYNDNGETSDNFLNEKNSKKIEKTKSLILEEIMENIYNLGDMDNNIIYKLLLYDTFDVTYKPIGVLINRKGDILNKYININKREEEINSFIYENHKSSYEPLNINNYTFKFDNIANLNNLNVFAPIFILFSEQLDFNLLKQYNDLIEEYKKSRKGKKIYFYFLPNENKKYDMLKNLCSANKPNEMVILDLFNQQIFKDSVNNLNVVQKIDEEKESKYALSKNNFFNFINRYYDNTLYSSKIQLIKQS